jgi:chaperonin GroEL (HSP60 family)
VNDVLGKLKSANTKEPSGIDINNGKIVESSKLGVWDHL